jgi:hypothetical protein
MDSYATEEVLQLQVWHHPAGLPQDPHVEYLDEPVGVRAQSIRAPQAVRHDRREGP